MEVKNAAFVTSMSTYHRPEIILPQIAVAGNEVNACMAEDYFADDDK